MRVVVDGNRDTGGVGGESVVGSAALSKCSTGRQTGSCSQINSKSQATQGPSVPRVYAVSVLLWLWDLGGAGQEAADRRVAFLILAPR